MGDGIVKKNKIISILLAVVLVITLVPVSGMVVSAETNTGTCGENLIWTIEDGTLTISGTGKMNSYADGRLPEYNAHKNSIKKVVIDNGVTSVGAYSFKSYRNVVEVTISNTVEEIGAYSFYDMSKLENLKLGDNIKSIGEHTFDSAFKLKQLSLPDGLVTIGDFAFSNARLIEDLKLPDSVTTIGDYAFSYCANLRKIYIGANTDSFLIRTFQGCNAIAEIRVSEKNKNYSNDNYGVLFNKNKTKLLLYPSAATFENYKIPDSVQVVGTSAFTDSKNLKNITAGENIKEIESSGFSGLDSITSIEFYRGLEKIGVSAFQGCKNMVSITIPDTVKNIDRAAFRDCDKLKDVYFSGTAEQWSKISINSSNNDKLIDAEKHYEHGVHICEFGSWNVVKSATCTEKGLEERKCACGKTETKEIPMFDHSFGAWKVTKTPTCKSSGEETRSCSCGETEKRIVDMTDHSSGEWETLVEATCIKTGKKVKRCIVCSTVLKEEQIEKTDHKYGKWYVTKQPTANETGIEECKCSVCGNTKQRVIPELGNTEILLGDVNGDGKIAATDARLILQFVAGLKTEKDLIIANADVNKDGKIAATDARMILQMVAGLV